MDKNENCYACNIKLDKDNYKNDRPICKNCYNEKKRKSKNNNTLIQNQQPRNDNVNTINNNRKLLVGSSFSGKTFLMLKILSRMPDPDIYIFTKSPPEQNSHSNIKIKEITVEIKPLNEKENAIIVLDESLGSSNSRQKDQFL